MNKVEDLQPAAAASAPSGGKQQQVNQKSKVSKGLSLLKKAVPSDQQGGGDQPKQNKFEALALCYANRSAALRRLCQYEDCLRDIARAARFGYPKENMFKLWDSPFLFYCSKIVYCDDMLKHETLSSMLLSSKFNFRQIHGHK